MLQQLKDIFYHNRKIAENYLFMVLLQGLNIGFYLIIYPILIRRLGQDSYGLYAFAMSLIAIIMVFVNFGFDLPGTRRIARIIQATEGNSPARQDALSETLSHIMTAKIGIEVLTTMVFAVGLIFIPFLRANSLVFLIGYLQTITCILFPQWYYQGIQQMRLVTYIQLICKLLSIPFILIFVHEGTDIWLLMAIISASSLMGGILSWLQIRYWHHLRVRILWSGTRAYYKEAIPFVLSNAMGILKEQGIVILVGAFLGMADVAIYDLANKIITVPRVILMQINNALFPKVGVSLQRQNVRRILWTEVGLGIAVIAAVALLGNWMVLLLGSEMMLPAYPICILLSSTVLFWMVGTAYINFIFIPTGNSQLVTWNQLIALTTCLAISVTWLILSPSVYAIVAGITISGMCEVLFCAAITAHKKLITRTSCHA